MTTSRSLIHYFAALLAMGFAVSVLAQESGPIPPAPSDQTISQNPPPQKPVPAAPMPPVAAIPSANPNAKIEVPTGTHIPLVLHNAISTRSARAGDPVY